MAWLINCRRAGGWRAVGTWRGCDGRRVGGLGEEKTVVLGRFCAAGSCWVSACASWLGWSSDGGLWIGMLGRWLRMRVGTAGSLCPCRSSQGWQAGFRGWKSYVYQAVHLVLVHLSVLHLGLLHRSLLDLLPLLSDAMISTPGPPTPVHRSRVLNSFERSADTPAQPPAPYCNDLVLC